MCLGNMNASLVLGAPISQLWALKLFFQRGAGGIHPCQCHLHWWYVLGGSWLEESV